MFTVSGHMLCKHKAHSVRGYSSARVSEFHFLSGHTWTDRNGVKAVKAYYISTHSVVGSYCLAI